MIAICCIVSSAISAHVDNDKPISVAMLPAKAQAVITRHFSHQRVVLAKKESGAGKSYDVVLRNGTKLEFDKRGNLTEIDCKRGSVPAELIPYPHPKLPAPPLSRKGGQETGDGQEGV